MFKFCKRYQRRINLFWGEANLIQKIIYGIAPVFLCFFIVIGVAGEKIIANQIIQNIESSINLFAIGEVRNIQNHFKNLENLGLESERIIRKWITNPLESCGTIKFNAKYQYIDGALRTNVSAFTDKDISGIFLSNRSELNDEIRQIIAKTEGKFENYAKGVKSLVFNTYLITRHQLIRIYVKDWALKIEKNHDFHQDLFYYIADPEHNPQGKPKWTKPYYDSIWKRWMTSLIIPVYIDQNFFGIVGHDIILDDIYSNILDKKYFETGYGFIFDAKKNIIAHPRHTINFSGNTEMGTLLESSKLGNKELTRAISEIVDNKKNSKGSINVFKFYQKKDIHYLFSYKLNILNWYFAIVIPKQEILGMLPRFRLIFIVGVVGASMVLYSIVIFILWISVVSPIKRLTDFVNNIRKGHLDIPVIIKGKDEIGQLSRSFSEMTHKLKERLSELKEAEENYRGIFENAVEGIYQSTPEGRLKSANPSLASILGYDGPTDLITSITNIGEQMYFDSKHREELLRRFEEKDIVSGFEVQMYKKDRSIIWVSLNSRAIRNKDGQLNSIEGMITDITRRKQAGEILQKAHDTLENKVLERTHELLIAKNQAEAANIVKNEFMASMSHELRTPLNAIIGYAQILKKQKNLTPRQRDRLHVVNSSGEHLLTLIDDILDIARIESGKVELQHTTIHLPTFLETISAVTYSRAESKGLVIKFEVQDTLPPFLLADETRLRQILLNLLDNAIKYTKKGHVILRIKGRDSLKPSDFHTPRPKFILYFEVEDTGIGISSEQFNKIFEPFEQVGKKKYEIKGTGLGLAISHKLVELMGGSLRVESKTGKGSRFSFEISLSIIDQPPAGLQTTPLSIKGYKGSIREILIVDDSASNRDILTELLKPIGFKIVEASSGLQAVQLVKEMRYDLILMDRWMPEMDGFEAIEQIQGLTNRQTGPIIAMSASVSEKDQALSKELGYDDFLPKPISWYRLEDIIKKHLRLDWIYKKAVAKDSLNDQPQSLLLSPPASDLNALYDLALRGDMREILNMAKRIDKMGPKYGPFAKGLRNLAERCEEKKILTFLKALKKD